MNKYKFTIQACIGIMIETDKPIEEARMMIVDNINEYSDDMVKDCTVSDGEEIK